MRIERLPVGDNKWAVTVRYPDGTSDGYRFPSEEEAMRFVKRTRKTARESQNLPRRTKVSEPVSLI